MSFWKQSKDKAALARIKDEAFHEQAYFEIQSGRRRHGLWAKAIIGSGGDETKAKITYLQLLVSTIRDEEYLATRVAEELAAKKLKRDAFRQHAPDVPALDPVNSYNSSGYTPLMVAVLAKDIAQVKALLDQGARVSIKDDNFRTSTALDMAQLERSRAKTDEERKALDEIIHCIGAKN